MKFSLLPLLAVSVAAAPSITTDLMTRQVSGLNFNAKELKAGSFQCKYAALIFARGTGEPGNLGSVVGPGLATKLKAAMNGDLLVQGADYTTNFSGGGATEMVKLARQVIEKCPGKTRLIFGGYSQGAMQVHQAIEKLGADAKNVRAAVTFGDPYSKRGFTTKTGFNSEWGMIFCAKADMVCGTVPALGGKGGGKKGTSGTGSHLAYSSDGSINEAVKFIVERMKSG